MFYLKKLDFIMRYFLILAACLSLSTQSMHGIIMTGEGIETASGFIKWDNLVSVSHQVSALQNTCNDFSSQLGILQDKCKDITSLSSRVRILQAACIVLAAAVLYIKYFGTKCDSKQEESKIAQ
jgi:hypothetical protein